MKKVFVLILLSYSSLTYSQSTKKIGDKVLVATNDKKNLIYYQLTDELGLEGTYSLKTYWYIRKGNKSTLLFKNISLVDMSKWLDKNKFKVIKL